jgi:predicted nucleotidyltransferase
VKNDAVKYFVNVVKYTAIVVEYTTNMNETIEKLFGSRIRAKILGWLFAHTDESYFVRQLSSILQEDPTNLSRELASLEKMGILISFREGNLKKFRVSRECSFFEEMKGFVLKTVGIAGQLKSALGHIKGLNFAFLYGSIAKGNEDALSDVDLLIIGEVNLDELDNALTDLERKLGRTINYVLYNRKELREKKRKKDGFVMDVLKGEKIWLFGIKNEFKKI